MHSSSDCVRASSASEQNVTKHTERESPGGQQQFPLPGLQRIYTAGITHPGVEHRQNQDDFFIWQDTRKSHVVIGVLDGHGRELGKAAAIAAKTSFSQSIPNLAKDDFKEFRLDPVGVFQRMFDEAHKKIGKDFAQILEQAGYSTKWENDALLKSNDGIRWQSVSGGTTCTVLIVLDGHKCYVAHVGDSDCLVCSKQPHSVTKSVAQMQVCDVSIFADTEQEQPNSDKVVKMTSHPHDTMPGVQLVECTVEHSAESLREFNMMRDFRPSPDKPTMPEIRFLYDAFGYMKHCRPAVFKEREDSPGVYEKTNAGVYHKNVRAEFASLVCTPPNAEFQDGLAFTRSLGDFYLHSYGVSSTVDVQCLDLKVCSKCDDGKSNMISICLATDGLWDNWKFSELVSDLFSPAFLSGLEKDDNFEGASKASSASAATNVTGPTDLPGAISTPDVILQRSENLAVRRNAARLMRLNHVRATTNFGSSMDNMTHVLIYVLPPIEHEASSKICSNEIKEAGFDKTVLVESSTTATAAN